MSNPDAIQQLKSALDTMYTNADQTSKMTATHFLESFQRSQEAWEIVHTVLNDDSITDIQFKLFAAQTLRSKVTYDLSHLPESNYENLKNSIIELLKKYSTENQQKLIRIQLSIALSQLCLQYLSWLNPIPEIISQLSSNPQQLSSLLDFLKILPEELTDIKKSTLTDEEFDSRIKILITNNVEQILSILKDLVDSSSSTNNKDSKLNSLILDCLNSWIKEFPIDKILQINSLTNLIFQSLLDDLTFDKSIECLITIISETKDFDNFEIIDALYQQILQLNNYVISNPDFLQDSDKVSGLTRLYVEACESWHALIAKNPKHFKPLVEILLEACKYDEDLDIVKYTFYFWYLLKQIITLPKFEESRLVFSSVYEELISIILKHLTYPTPTIEKDSKQSNNDDDLFDGDKEQEDKFKEFRYEMGDVLKDCCSVVGTTTALNIPFKQIQRILSSNDTNAFYWQYLEAPLFSMRTMAKVVSTKENTILPSIMSFLIKLPEHPKIRYAATLVLGRYSEWTAKNPQFLAPQITYIVKGFEIIKLNPTDTKNNQDIIISASRALMYFCKDCSSLLVEYLEQLYMLYGQINDQLDIESNYELVDGLAHVIQQVPPANLYKTTEMFIEPTLNKIQQLTSTGQSTSEDFNIQLADQIEILTIFIKVLRTKDFTGSGFPVCDLFIAKIWPIVPQILNKYGLKSVIVSERCLKLLKASIQSYSTYLNKLLPEIAMILHEGFKTTKFGCYLWVSGILIREYGDEYTSEEIKESVYQFGISQSFTFFELIFNESNDESIKNMPDVIDDFFRMIDDLLMYYPFKVIPNLDFLKSILKLSLINFQLINEYEPTISCVHFLIDLVSWGSSNPPISLFNDENPEFIKKSVQDFLILDNNGGALLQAIINGLIFKFNIDTHQDINDLILKILVVIPDSNISINWLHQVVQSLPNVNNKEIEKLINTLGVALVNKDNRRVRSSLKDFVNWYSRKNVKPRSEF
ncbi:armadillo-type protein [Scheffersomyces coipomensis]|uniref:armadillo-type protein n=1 Tax=Scheffersomyces coipomensis TaxID=1788519 RepID=UPI00315D1D04